MAIKRIVTFVLLITSLAQSLPASWAETVYERPQPILYIAAEPGCYSLTYLGRPRVPLQPPKRIFRVSCFAKHHYEVYWAGQIPTRPGNPIPESRDSVKKCEAESNKVAFYGRGGRSYNYGPDERAVYGNWLPDKGPEAKRYPKRVVCMYGVSTKEFQFLKEISEPLVKGLE